MGQAEAGLSLVADAMERAGRMAGRWIDADLHRVRGDLLHALAEPETTEAEVCFRRALAIAREQSAKLWELRAATSLARLWAEQSRRAEARELLAPVDGWFIEGFDTPDLRDAKALLDALQ